ncbi:MAG: peptidyl-prolyl cis-trans isomerase [Candidatus Omnitrophota bacterium]
MNSRIIFVVGKIFLEKIFIAVSILGMLNAFRERHMKKVLWGLAGVIIFVFGLSGANFFLRGRVQGSAASINNRKVTTAEFDYYFKLARLHLILTTENTKEVSRQNIEGLGLEFMALLWKAKQDKIKVDDQEVIAYIVKNFFPDGNFSENFYNRFLQYLSRTYGLSLTSRNFEEYIRDFILVDKVFKKYTQAAIKDEEIRDLYKAENQKAKIDYLFISYEKFKVDVGINPKDIEDFYQENKALFQEEPRAKIRYISVEKSSDLADKILKSLPQIARIEDLENKFSLKANESEFSGANSPIEGIGWQLQINKIAFGLEKNKIGPPITTEKNLIILEKIEETPPVTPPLNTIEEKVKEKLITIRAKDEVKRFAKEFLEEILKQESADLEKIANKENNIEFKETDYFKRYDYIEGLGLDKAVSEIVFSLEKGQIYSEPIMLSLGAYIIRQKDMTLFNEEDFQKDKQEYLDKIKQNKGFTARIEFLTQLKKDTNLRFLSN